MAVPHPIGGRTLKPDSVKASRECKFQDCRQMVPVRPVGCFRRSAGSRVAAMWTRHVVHLRVVRVECCCTRPDQPATEARPRQRGDGRTAREHFAAVAWPRPPAWLPIFSATPCIRCHSFRSGPAGEPEAECLPPDLAPHIDRQAGNSAAVYYLTTAGSSSARQRRPPKAERTSQKR